MGERGEARRVGREVGMEGGTEEETGRKEWKEGMGERGEEIERRRKGRHMLHAGT